VTEQAHTKDRGSALLQTVRDLIPSMQARASDLDRDAAFPAADIDALRQAGALIAPLPERFGGLGAGTEPGGAALARELLVLCGRGNPSVARLFEAHVNAIRLMSTYGAADRAAADVLAGHLFGLWVTDAGAPVRVEDGILHGSKGPCSGAGHCTRAVITAEFAGATRLFLVAPSPSGPVRPVAGLHGMRAAANGVVTLDGVAGGPCFGEPGDYLREPDFSCGAWRASAAALGALEALVEATRTQLIARRHDRAEMQQARFGTIVIARDTARLWVERACAAAEHPGDPAEQVATVNLARIAVETACLDAMRAIQRSLGLAAFVAPNPVERLIRDLATYLRQPAPDAVLTEAAAYFLRRTC